MIIANRLIGIPSFITHPYFIKLHIFSWQQAINFTPTMTDSDAAIIRTTRANGICFFKKPYPYTKTEIGAG
jgi:hypothetical protein